MRKQNNHFWRLENSAANPDVADLFLYGDIANETWWGDETTPGQFQKELAAMGNVDTINVHINSGGGDMWAAVTIGNLLEATGAQTVARIEGLCASAATLIACHCGKVVAAKDSTYMIHPAKAGMMGSYTKQELENTIKMLDSATANAVELYCKKTKKCSDEVEQLMAETNWWTAQQAMDHGFVDEITGDAVNVQNNAGILVMNQVDTGIAFEAAPKFVKDRAAGMPGGVSDNTTGNDPTTEEGETMEINNVEEMRAAFPALCEQLENTAASNATAAERARLQRIDSIAGGMDAAVVNDAKYGEHACTAEQLAYNAALAAHNAGVQFMQGVVQDAANSGANGVPAAEPGKTPAENDISAMRAKAKQDVELFNKMNKGVR